MHAYFFNLEMKKETKAIIEMLICATLWSIAGIFMKKLPWNGFAIASLRSIIAATTIAIYMALKKIHFTINGKNLIAGLLAGLTYLAFTVSNKLTTASNAIVLQFTSPVFVLIYSALLYKQKIRKRDAVTVFFTLLGVALCFLDGIKGGYMLGNFVAVSAGMFMAGMYVAIGDIEGDNRFSAALIGQIVTAVVGFPWVIATKPVITVSTVSFILILGVFQLGISYILYVKSTKYCPPLACCLLGVIEPLLNPVWVMIFDGERPGVIALIGSVIVIATVTLWCAFSKDNDKEKEIAL